MPLRARAAWKRGWCWNARSMTSPSTDWQDVRQVLRQPAGVIAGFFLTNAGFGDGARR
jgi:hypothetical protein